MSREDQYIGLTKKATDYLCKPDVQVVRLAAIEGAFDPIVGDLNRYILKSGRVLEEFIQDIPWSSGPMYFIGIKEKDKIVKRLSWKFKRLKNGQEFDYEKGIYWV